MAAENTMHMLSQYSAESRQFFNRVSSENELKNILSAGLFTHLVFARFLFQAINGNGRIDAIADATRNAWSNLMRLVQQMKEAAAELTDPSILSEHLRVIFRDESETNVIWIELTRTKSTICFVLQLR